MREVFEIFEKGGRRRGGDRSGEKKKSKRSQYLATRRRRCFSLGPERRRKGAIKACGKAKQKKVWRDNFTERIP